MVVVLLLVSAGYAWYSKDNSWSPSTPTPTGHRAAIVDQLSASYRDSGFLDNATFSLRSMDYTVDYYGPAAVTVDFFRDLPSKGYGLVVIRAHSGSSSIYTSEQYDSSKHVFEQLTDRVLRVFVDGGMYFAVSTKFIQDAMRGSFPGSLIVMMGCGGLSGTGLAEAFIGRGAAAFVGWNSWVSGVQTDLSTAVLLAGLAHGATLKEAVSQSGIDPQYSSRLGYYDASLAPRQKLNESLLGLSALLTLMVLPVLAMSMVVLLPKLLSRL